MPELVTFWMKECGKATLRLVKRNICIFKKNHYVTNEFQNNVLFSRLRVLSCKWFKVMTFLNLTAVQLFSCEALHCAQLLQCVVLGLNTYALHNAIAI